MHDELYGPALREVIGLLSPMTGWRCADVGTGTGAVADVLSAAVGAHGTVYAVDRNPDATTEAAALGPPVIGLTMPAEELALPEEVLLCCCRFLLVHVADPAAVVEAMTAAVPPGGYVLVEEPVTTLGTVAGRPLAMPAAAHPDAGALVKDLAISAGLELLVCSSFTPTPPSEEADAFLEELSGVPSTGESIVLPPLVTVLGRRRGSPGEASRR